MISFLCTGKRQRHIHSLYLRWLRQSEWLQGGLADCGHAWVCSDNTQAPLQCDIRYINKWTQSGYVLIRPRIPVVKLFSYTVFFDLLNIFGANTDWCNVIRFLFFEGHNNSDCSGIVDRKDRSMIMMTDERIEVRWKREVVECFSIRSLAWRHEKSMKNLSNEVEIWTWNLSNAEQIHNG